MQQRTTTMKALPFIPYAGLSPYSEEIASFFFGREKVRDNIIANLKAKRLTLILGASGVGKSSVLNAGVAHKLRLLAQENLYEKGEPEFAVVVFDKWRDDPLAGLTARVRETVREALDERTLEPVRESESLADTLQSWAERLGGDLLIILDQFEDYFLYHGDEDGRSGFAQELARLVNRSDLRVNLLISIRDDAFSKIERFKESKFFDNLIEIEHLDREAATRAIESPIDQYNRFYAASKQRITIDQDLVEEVLNQVRKGRLSLGEGGPGFLEAKSEASGAKARIETPFLQLVMTELWKEELLAGETSLKLETLNRLGGAERIVKTHLSQVMEKLSEDEQYTAARIFSYLVTPSGDKFALSATDLAELAEVDRKDLVLLLEKLSRGSSRILRAFAPSGADSESRYEVFHDVLAKAILDWRRAYAQKQKERQAEEDKRRAAESARAEEKAQSARLRRRLSIAIVMSLLVGAAIALWQYDRATTQKRIAIAEAEKADSLQKANVNAQSLARIYQILIEGTDPQKADETLTSVLVKFNDALEGYRRDDNKAGQGMTLNNMAGILRLFGESYSRRGYYEKAASYYQQAQDNYQQAQSLLESAFGPDHPEVATSLNDQAVIYVAQGKYAEAEPLLKRSLSILEKILKPDDRYLADPIRNLAESYYAQGKYNEAEPLYSRALEIRRDRLSSNHPAVAESLNDLAWLYYKQGKYDEAESLFNESLNIWENDPDPDSKAKATQSLNGLGAIYRMRREYNRAEEKFKQAEQRQGGVETILNKDLIALAEVLENRALLYADQGEFADAEPLFEAALLLWGKSLAPDHPTRAYGMSNLASLYSRLGRYADAEPLFKEALAIQEQAIPVHPDLVDTLNNYAALLQKTNREAEAAQMQERAKQIQDARNR